jgi:hypothetical protein
MLKRLPLLLIFWSLGAFACWKVEGTLAVDGESWKFQQKIDHERTYSFPLGTFILNAKLSKEKILSYEVFEKEGAKRTLVTKGSKTIKENSHQDIFAQGEEGQPHSIITLKLIPL